jgi:hypothetical protein
MIGLDIFSLFLFVLSILFIVNQSLGVIKNILSDEPKKISYVFWEKISNYLFLSYFITYIILKMF